MDLAERLRAVLEARTQAGQGEARAQLGEAKDALAGRRDVLELLHQWITCARGGKNVLAGEQPGLRGGILPAPGPEGVGPGTPLRGLRHGGGRRQLNPGR